MDIFVMTRKRMLVDPFNVPAPQYVHETAMARIPKEEDQHSEPETVQRADAAVKRMLSTPHQRHKPLGKKPKSPRRKRANERLSPSRSTSVITTCFFGSFLA
jgi:hypothetical protein